MAMSFEGKNILFVNDGGIQNPIVHSQGLPLLDYYAELGLKPSFISFENYVKDKNEQKRIKDIKKRFSGRIKYYEIKYKTYRYFPNWVLYFFHGIRNTLNVVRNENIYVLHARSLYPAVIGLIIKTLFMPRIKLLYDNRGVFIIEEIFKNHWKANSLKVKLFKTLEKHVVKKSDAIVVVSNRFKNYLVEYYHEINISEKVYVIPNGATIDDSLNVNYNNDEMITAVYSGSFVEWQKSENLMNVFRELIRKKIKIKVLTYSRKEFFDFLENQNIDSSAISIETLSSENVHAALTKCSFGILIRENNLINNVSSPLKFAEYLNAGLPVLISEGIGDTAVLVNRERIGIILKENVEESINNMMNLLNEKDIRQRCKRVANKFYNIHSGHEKYLKILNNFNGN